MRRGPDLDSKKENPVEEGGTPSNCAGTKLERVTRLELATSSLARRCSTTELHPQLERVGIMSTASVRARFLSERHAVALPMPDCPPLCNHSFAAAISPGTKVCHAASMSNVTFALVSRSIAARRSAFSTGTIGLCATD